MTNVSAAPAAPRPPRRPMRNPFRRSNIHLASLVLSGLLILFMFAVLFIRPVVGAGGMAWLQSNFWWMMLLFLNVQLWETSQRPSTDMQGFAVDSFLAILSVLVGLGFFLLYSFSQIGWITSAGEEERAVILQGTLFSATDVVWGILVSLRIAFSGKEREEYRGGPV